MRLRLRLLLLLLSLLLLGWSHGKEEVEEDGLVHTLTGDNFDGLVRNSKDLWFLKFYAPWCSHCKRLAPVLDRVAPRVSDKMLVGKIDCTSERALCDAFRIKGYPTLKAFRDGEAMDYPGGRTEEDILRFARRMSAAPIRAVSSFQQATDLIRDTPFDIGFVVYHPDAKGDTLREQLLSTPLTTTIRQASRKQQANTNFYYLNRDGNNDNNSDKPFVAKIEQHVAPVIYESPSLDGLVEWIETNNVPLVAHLTSRNFHTISRSGKPLVVGAMDGSITQEVETMQVALAKCAETKDDYNFGYMDGVMWQPFLAQFDVEQLPQVLVLDMRSKVYWQDASYGYNVMDFLEAIDQGVVPQKDHPSHRGFTGRVRKLENWFFRNLPYSLIGLVTISMTMLVYVVATPQEMRPPYPKHKQE